MQKIRIEDNINKLQEQAKAAVEAKEEMILLLIALERKNADSWCKQKI